MSPHRRKEDILYQPPRARGHVARGLFQSLVALVVVTALATPALAQQYSFTKVADSAEDGFDPFSFGCASINSGGDIAFRAGRPHRDGFNTVHGIYRANADGTLTTIAQNDKRFVQIGFNPSMNDLGQVSFAARIDGKPDTESILRGSGKKLTTIASTADEFNFFGFDTSISNSGEVAFKAELDEEFGFDEGLFSGVGRAVTTHYLASTSRFDGTDSRPSINNLGAIAFDERVNFDDGIFVGREGEFTVIAAPDPDVSVQEPVLNDSGNAAFVRSFFDEASQEFVEEIALGNGGRLTPVVDTRGAFAFFGFRPPSLNNTDEVAFQATLDDGTSGIFVGPDAALDRAIAVGDTLDGATVQNLTFCEEGLNDSGRLGFIAQLEDAGSPAGFRMAVFRATPSP
jgi:hypothetical protein